MLTIPITESRLTSIVITGNKKVPTLVVMARLATKDVVVGTVYNDNNLRKALTAAFDPGEFATLGPVDLQTPLPGQVAVTIPVKEK